MPHIYMLLRIGEDKTVMICNTRLPHITSGLRLYIKRVKKSRSANINYHFVCYVTNKHVLCIICQKYLFKTMHPSHALKFSGTDVTLDQIRKSPFCCPRYGVLFCLWFSEIFAFPSTTQFFRLYLKFINNLR